MMHGHYGHLGPTCSSAYGWDGFTNNNAGDTYDQCPVSGKSPAVIRALLVLACNVFFISELRSEMFLHLCITVMCRSVITIGLINDSR